MNYTYINTTQLLIIYNDNDNNNNNDNNHIILIAIYSINQIYLVHILAQKI